MLADHVIREFYPDCAARQQPYAGLLSEVTARTARLIAKWQAVGFCHGVMNTDNMSISGETIDYGPCAFMDAYHPLTVFSSIDQQGRYAYGNQPGIAQWNLARLAEALLPLLAEDIERAIGLAQEALSRFPERFEPPFHAGLGRKLGLAAPREGDVDLARDLLSLMAASQADFTLAFRRLGDAVADRGAEAAFRALFADAASIDAWLARWRERLAQEPQDGAARSRAMHAVNPVYIPRNHGVQAVISAAVERGDYAPFEELLAVLARPFEPRPEFADYALPPQPEERVLETFCGT